MSQQADRVVDSEAADLRWRGLYIAGGVAALIAVLFFRRWFGVEIDFALLLLVPTIYGMPTATSAPFRVSWMVLIAFGLFRLART